jgi:16S rRNA (cytidine1402-2'-O)-methyltransferase
LKDLAEIMGPRDAAICREMTKMHEEVRRATLAELARAAGALETRGEFVLVVGPAAAGTQAMTEEALDDLLRERLKRDSVKDAVAHAVELSGRPRREIYARALELARETKEQLTSEGEHDED